MPYSESEGDPAQKMTAGNSRLEILLALLVPVSVALAAFFSWIVMINSLRIPFYLYYERTIFLIFIDRFLDPIIWIVSSVLALALVAEETRDRSHWFWLSILFYSLGTAIGTLALLHVTAPYLSVAGPLATFLASVFAGIAVVRRRYFTVVFSLVLSLLIFPVEAVSLVYYVLSAFWPGIGVGKSWELLELQLWYTASPLIPFLYVAFLFSWIWTPLVAWMMPRLHRHPSKSFESGINPEGSKAWLVTIGGFTLLAAFLGYYAYFHDPTYPLVGTDIYWRYALPAERVLESGSWMAAAAKERHPVVVLGIAFLSHFSGASVETLLRFAYIGLALMFGAVLFLLVLFATKNRTLASCSALISAISASTTVGIYTAIVANWVALIVWAFSLVSLAQDRGRGFLGFAIPVLGLGLGSLVVIFIHPWTWVAMMFGIVAYALTVLVLRLKNAVRDAASILVVILINAATLALSLLVLSKMQGWRVAAAFTLVQNTLGNKYLGFGSWEIVVFFSRIWSQFLHPLTLILAIIGVLVLVRRRDRFSAIVIGWLIATCATSLIAAPMGYNSLAVNRGETQLFRALFLTSLQMPCAVALLFIKSSVQARLAVTAHPRTAKLAMWVVVGVILLAIANGALRALFPLLTDPHNYPWPDRP